MEAREPDTGLPPAAPRGLRPYGWEETTRGRAAGHLAGPRVIQREKQAGGSELRGVARAIQERV